ncbi:MAG: hypothetical protein K8T25_18895 [Planctomycetia bacterium]|nr:hypothetical protein [Planctomycetia bacterium]
MRNLLTAVASLICLVPLLGCTTNSHSGEKLSITLPQGWSPPLAADPHVSHIGVRPFNNPNEVFREKIYVVEKKNTTSDFSLAMLVAAVKKGLGKRPHFSIVAEGDLDIHGVPTHWTEIESELNVGEVPFQLHELYYFIERSGTSYVITCSATDAAFPQYRPVFEKAAESVRFR